MQQYKFRGSLQRLQTNPPQLCISIFGRNLIDLLKKIRVARSFDASFIELRLDYLDKIESSDLVQISGCLSGNEILTLRSPSEGGMNKLTKTSRRVLLRKIISSVQPAFVDFEISTLESDLELLGVLQKSRTRLIASSHDFDKTESISHLRNLVRGLPKCESVFAVKVVRKARRFDDNRRILSLYDLRREIAPARLVAFCAGELGIFSRLVCTEFGSPFTYVSLPGESTAPGQLDVERMSRLLSTMK